MSTLMKLALVGYGKMGTLVEKVAGDCGGCEFQVVERFTRKRPLRSDEATRQALGEGTVLVDFSVPDAVVETARAATDLGLNLVIGTTGWHGRLDEVRALVQEAGTGLVYGSNFSLGTNLFFRVVRAAAQAFAAFEEYDPFIEEAHHKFKVDAPSGTALVLKRKMEEHYRDRDVPVVSLRAGYVPGTHRVSFDSAADTVTLEHRARSRQGFAEGALVAARWISGRRGFHSFEAVLDDIYPKSSG